jgi:NAD(P)H-hydrate epimerase
VLFLSPEAMQEVDRRTIEGGAAGAGLMDAAGHAVAEETWSAWPRPDWRVAVVCGSGNNGGDGFVAARSLLGRYRSVTAYLAGDPGRLSGDARDAAEGWRGAAGETVPLSSAESLRQALAGTDLLIDALLGTGTHGDVRGLYGELLEVARDFTGPVVAVDNPSGLDLRTGKGLGAVPRAALTVTFGAAKLGHLLGDGPEVCGRLVVRDIGLDPVALAEAAARDDAARALEPGEAERLLPIPARRSHKRSNGVVAVLAGSRRYAGAPVLACAGALRSGAGLVYAVVPEPLKPGLNAARAELIVTGVPPGDDGGFGRRSLEPALEALEFARPDALVLGPGMGGGAETAVFVHQLLGRLEEGMAAALDADALNAFAGEAEGLRAVAARLRLALTPHPGELGRVLGRPARELDETRLDAARDAARGLGCAVLLKGAPTVISASDRGTLLNPTGNAGLARGGTGDVLSGIVGSFLSKSLPPFDALGLAAYVHGLAGDLARAELGSLAMTASDVAERLAPVLRAFERGEGEGLVAGLAPAAAPAGGRA